jgi:AcrR family transcriptional regulator
MPKVVATEEQWLQKGIERFSQNGIEGLVIERMSIELGCSKSSFYWYFKNRGEFVRRVVERWMEQATDQVMQYTKAQGTIEQQINQLLVQMFSVTRKGDFLFYLRKLSAEDPDYQEIIDRMEYERIHFGQELLEKAGLTPKRAEQKSRILYHYYLGWYERHKYQHVKEEEVQHHIDMLQSHLLMI